MSDHQAVIELVHKAEHDAALREALQKTSTPEDVVQVAEAAGLAVTVGEIHAFRQHIQALQQQSANGELSESQLEGVAGGFDPFTGILIGGLAFAGVCTIGGLGLGAVGGVGVGAVGGVVGGLFLGGGGRS